MLPVKMISGVSTRKLNPHVIEYFVISVHDQLLEANYHTLSSLKPNIDAYFGVAIFDYEVSDGIWQYLKHAVGQSAAETPSLDLIAWSRIKKYPMTYEVMGWFRTKFPPYFDVYNHTSQHSNNTCPTPMQSTPTPPIDTRVGSKPHRFIGHKTFYWT